MKKIVKISIYLMFVKLIVLPGYAQQNIITIPSSELLPKGEVILKQSNRFSTFGNNFVTLTPTATMGLGWGTEMSVAAGTTLKEGDEANVSLDITGKKVIKIKKAARLSIGGRIKPSLTESKNPDSMIYVHGSFLMTKTRTTLTTGGYVSGYGEMPNSTGIMLGIDQVIIPKKLRLVADWMSRDDSGCALSAGFKLRPEPTTSITAAVIIPNNNSNPSFIISVSKYVGKVLPEKKKERDEL